MATTLDIFISSKMLELKSERDALYDLLPTLDYGDLQLRAWVFEEDAPASSRSIRDIYLEALQNSTLYIGLFWNQYGEWTIDEFDRATDWGIDRHIYVKNVDADQRDPRLQAFLDQHGAVPTGVTAKWFTTTDELCEAVKASIEKWVRDRLSQRDDSFGRTYTVTGIFAQQPNEIPEQPEKLFGRETLQTEVETALNGGKHVLLLQGFGGMGKTALAATLAAKWVQATGPVLWIKAGQANADALLEGLARPFGAEKAMAGAQGEAKIDVLHTILARSGATLLVIDDAWEGDALAPLLTAIPADLPVLLTSRTRHAVGEIKTVGELDPAAALNLLEQHAGIAYAGDADAARLCETLGYHAFAIEIAGRTLQVDQLTPTELLRQVENAPHALAVPNELALPGRHRVADLIEVSLNALKTKGEQLAYDVFLAFGAFFAPSATPELLELYMQSSVGATLASPTKTPDVASALTTLARRGLAERVPRTENAVAFFRIHDLAYSYARAQVNDDAHHRAIDACLNYTEKYNTPNLENFAALRPEVDNFMGATDWAFIEKKYADAQQFAWDLVGGGSGFFAKQGYYLHSISLLHLAAKAAAKQKDYTNVASHIGNTGIIYKELAQFKKALHSYKLALRIDFKTGNKLGQQAGLGCVGVVYDLLERVMNFCPQPPTPSPSGRRGANQLSVKSPSP